MRQRLTIKISFSCLLIFTILVFNPGRVGATSWVRLQPNEVISRAEVIIQGTYDFNDVQMSTLYNGMWRPFKFNIEKYIKGSGTMVIDAAIEMNDVEWVKQFQEQKGSFVLFLRRDEKSPTLFIPVGGPNGMLQVQDGNFQNIESSYAQQYKDFLANQPKITSNEETEIISNVEGPIKLAKKSIAEKAWPWFLALITLGVGGLVLVKLQRKR